jgi:hypothetical protein
MANYKKNAKEELAIQGFTASRIAESFSDILLQTVDPHRSEEVSIKTLAEEFVDEAATWPPKVSMLGIVIPSLKVSVTQAVADGAALIDIPESLITQEMCEIAVDLDGYAIGQVPPSMYTDALVLKALEKGASLQAVPPERQTEATRIAAVERSWNELKFIPAEHQSEAVKLAAVKNSGHALQYIAVESRSDSVLLEAVKSQPMALEHIPDHQQTDEVMLEAVSRRGAAIQFIQKDDQSDEVLQAAFSDKTFSIASLGNVLRNDYRKVVGAQRKFSSSEMTP